MAQRNMSPKKCPMPSLAPDYRNRVFEEVATGYTYEMAIEEARRCLRKILLHGSSNARSEAWKIVDSGVVGHRIQFLLLRFLETAKSGRAISGVLYPYYFGAHLTEAYSDVLLKWRCILFAGEILAIVVLLIKLLF